MKVYRERYTMLRGPAGLKKPNLRGHIFAPGQLIPGGKAGAKTPSAPTFIGPDYNDFDTAVGDPIDQNISDRWFRGNPAGTFTVNTLPSGLTLDPDGRLHGTTDTVELVSNIIVTCTNSEGADQSNSFNWNVVASASAPVFVGPIATQTGVVGQFYTHAYAQYFTGTLPFTWSLESGTIPTGLTLNTASGVISGIPDSLQSDQFVLRATNGAGTDVTTTVTFNVEGAPVFIGPDIANQNWTYGQAITPIDCGPLFLGLPAETFELDGTWPDGIVIDANTGVISGTPVGVVYPPGAKAAWNLTTDLNDSVGTDHLVAENGAAVVGGALVLNGVDQHVHTAGDDNWVADNITYVGWVKRAAAQAGVQAGLWGSRSTTNARTLNYHTDTNKMWGQVGNSVATQSVTLFQDDVWMFTAYRCTRGVTNNLSINNNINEDSGAHSATPNPNGKWFIGCSVTSGNTADLTECFNGEIKLMAVFHRLLTDQEILDLYNGGAGLPHP